jgi:hypothetical protein
MTSAVYRLALSAAAGASLKTKAKGAGDSSDLRKSG